MDSLTQITLGAAVGEIVLGRKIGNRAMIWGAVAGTIPDLDVISSLFTDTMNYLPCHRGFTHSILFSVLFGPFFGWAVMQYYERAGYRRPILKYLLSAFLGFVLLAIAFGSLRTAVIGSSTFWWIAGITWSLLVLPYGLRKLYKYCRTPVGPLPERVGLKEWSIFFFLALVTHPILDCFTTYGTSLYLPFSNERVAWNWISIVDPIYTVPFLTLVIIASTYARQSKVRRRLVVFSLVLSTSYLALCGLSKFRTDRAFKEHLASNQIEVRKYMSSATLFNSILWQSLAETENGFYYGVHSLFDSPNDVNFEWVPKNSELLAKYEGTKALRVLKWFTKGYYNAVQTEDGTVQLNDLRFGVRGAWSGHEEIKYNYFFHFDDSDENVTINDEKSRESFLTSEEMERFWHRIWGNNN